MTKIDKIPYQIIFLRLITPLANPSHSLLFSSSSRPHLSCIKHKSDLRDFNSLASEAVLLAIETASWKKIQISYN
jgi:hypothetical protein